VCCRVLCDVLFVITARRAQGCIKINPHNSNKTQGFKNRIHLSPMYIDTKKSYYLLSIIYIYISLLSLLLC
jgi:hypothetical protein